MSTVNLLESKQGLANSGFYLVTASLEAKIFQTKLLTHHGVHSREYTVWLIPASTLSQVH
jgi:hypothetical protein